LFQFKRIIRDYPPRSAEGLTPQTICSNRSSRSIAALRSNRLADYGSRRRSHFAISPRVIGACGGQCVRRSVRYEAQQLFSSSNRETPYRSPLLESAVSMQSENAASNYIAQEAIRVEQLPSPCLFSRRGISPTEFNFFLRSECLLGYVPRLKGPRGSPGLARAEAINGRL
jgi:hypothetical protein